MFLLFYRYLFLLYAFCFFVAEGLSLCGVRFFFRWSAMKDGGTDSDVKITRRPNLVKDEPITAADEIISGGMEEKSLRSGIITARGTGDGLVIRLDGRVSPKSLQAALYDFVLSRRSFLTGNEISFEWVGVEPSDSVVEALSKMLVDDFDIVVSSSYLQNAFPKKRSLERVEMQVIDDDDKLGLFGGMEGFGSMQEPSIKAGIDDFQELHSNMVDTPASVWDDPDARVIYATLRSGQRIETEHSLIVMGDVNSGAELIAGGDIIVLGTLRGVAHAGAYDETGGGRFIFSLVMQPTQLRIGVVISRGTPENGKCPEIARVDGSTIVVEPYHAKTALSKMRRF